MLIKLTVAAVLRALSLCGMGGFLAYVHHTDIRQLEQQWRRKTLPPPPQDLEPQAQLDDAQASEEKQTQGTPSYRMTYEVFEQRERYVTFVCTFIVTEFVMEDAHSNDYQCPQPPRPACHG